MPAYTIASVVAAALANGGGGSSLNAGMSFFAPLTTTMVPVIGAGTATFTRATVATVFDWEGILKTVLSSEVRFHGARRVANLIRHSESLSGIQWGSNSGGTGTPATCAAGFTDPIGGANAFRIQWNRGGGTTNSDFSNWGNNTEPFAMNINDISRNRMWVKSNTGANQNVMFLSRVANDVTASQVVTVTPTWRLMTTLFTESISSGNAQFAIGAFATFGDAVGDILVYQPMTEIVTGQSNQNPSEYVPNDATLYSAPFTGANVTGVRYFAWQNGNTVASNVVTEAQGAAIPAATLLGYKYEGARTNQCLWGRDFTNAAWVATTMTKALDQTGIDGVANSASSLLATGANATVKQTVTIAALNRPFSVWIKRITGVGNIDLAQDGAAFTTQAVTGAWQKFTLVANQLNPILSIRIVTNGDKIAVDYAALEDSGGAAVTHASTPIATTTVAVTRNADIMGGPTSSNMLGPVGTVYGEYTLDGLSATAVLVGAGSGVSGTQAFVTAMTDFNIADGTTTDNKPGLTDLSLGVPRKRVTSWGSNQRVYGDGGAPGLAAFDGDMNLGAVYRIGAQSDNSAPGYGTVRNVKFWLRQLTDTEAQGL